LVPLASPLQNRYDAPRVRLGRLACHCALRERCTSTAVIELLALLQARIELALFLQLIM